MSLKRLPIRSKITLLSFSIVFFSLLLGGLILIGNIVELEEEEYGKRAMITAKTVAQLPDVIRHVTEPNGWIEMDPTIEKIRIINNADYVTVLNMERIRYSHPVKDMLGTVAKGEDAGPAFAEHSYLSKAKGEVGMAVRAFAPIKNDQLEQVGVVVVGNVLPTMFETLLSLKNEILLIMFLTLLLGVIGSFFLAKHIKQQMFQLEPYEIARLLEERTATFHAMHEGVIAIDKHEMITIFNDKAKKMMNVHGDVIGKNIWDVIPDTRLPEILELDKPVFNQEVQVRGNVIMSNRVPIKVNKQLVGAVAIFQDRTETTKMAEELTGVKEFVEALRVQAHEHSNKLHTIAGLIQLGNNEQALKYIFQLDEEQGSFARFLNENILDDNLAGLLLGKVSRGKELGIKIVIDRKSHLSRFPKHLDHHDFVVILGNLIENAIAALKTADHRERRIDISIEQDDELCAILVEDNGHGISETEMHRIFENGFSTKKGFGLGLHLVKQIVEKGKGELNVVSHQGEGASFFISFPMNGLEEEE
ncbi:ATP-binding protein [Bacillus sp. FJAT-29937]|uniref:ATP-binding protein n=1 Tax=Bacillus sp. FJAT-29937 TaxID=1720553 RepID=UPI000832B807|nr:sensor histidine kinase [Bacillus sp. FJAT-29937]